MTKREKVLIVIGICVVVLFGSYRFLLEPAYNRYNEKSKLYGELSFEQKLTEEKIQNESGIISIHDRISEEYEQKKKLMPENMTNQELDRLITGICLKHNQIPTSLIVTSTQEPVKEGEVSPGVIDAKVSVTVTSSYENLQRLIDEINKSTYMRISALSYNQATTDDEENHLIQANIDFVILMRNTI